VRQTGARQKLEFRVGKRGVERLEQRLQGAERSGSGPTMFPMPFLAALLDALLAGSFGGLWSAWPVLHRPKGEREFLIGLLLLRFGGLEIAPSNRWRWVGGLNPATGFDFLLQASNGGADELWIGGCQPCRRDSEELAIEPMNALPGAKPAPVGDGAAEEECWRGCDQHGARSWTRW